MKRWLWLPALILAGCGSVATVQPSASPSAGALSCRLPVAVNTGNGEQPAFIQFPQSQLNPTTLPSFSGDQLRAWGAPAYDQPLSTWLPVPPAHVSPDGTRYAYSFVDWSGGGRPTVTHLHVVDVRSGLDRDVYDKGAYDVATFTDDAIYVVHHLPQTDASDGLWALDPDTGALRPITTGGIEWSVGGGAGWSADLVPGDTAPGKFPADRLLRLDLRTGTVTPWFTRPGLQVQVFGFDSAGHPMVVAGSPAKTEVWLVTAANAGTLVDSGPGWGDANGLSLHWPLVTDPRGVWMASNRGIYLYRTDTRLLQLVYPSTSPTGAKIDFVSGDCR
ncbi:MAG: hypothetical protein E6J01_12820 [Chloroflexi bacterium]|nr:MAG: hypothetical protein E6J01_12820 [Chloroflexota bacterium]